MKKLSLLVSGFALVMMSSFAFANTPDVVGPNDGNLKFNGTINASCNLQNFVDGTVVANVNQTTMSSKLSGGAAAALRVRANVKGYTLILGTPQLIGPNGAEQDVTFDLDPVGSGTDLVGTVKGNFSATNGKLKFDSGIYNFAVDGVATKNTGAFEAGTYILRVPVSCVADS